MTKGTDPPLLNKDFFHHLNQFAIVKNLFDDMGVGLPVIFAVRKTAFPAHFFTPSNISIRCFYLFGKTTEL
jgi:hypothetical protein